MGWKITFNKMSFNELKSKEFDRAISLFQGFDYSLSLRAAIEGNNPGRIFVDNIDSPRTAFALTVEGYLLAGDYEEPGILEALRLFWKEKIFTGEVFVNGDESLSLAVYPEAWENKLPILIPTHEIEKLPRYHYLCQEVKLDWRKNLPEGYTLRRVDREMLANSESFFSKPLQDWNPIRDMWFTEDDYLIKGISYCILHENRAVAWCSPDCVAGDQIDVGIYTDPAHRKRGLAAAVVAATVEGCFQHGYRKVGWHCNAENIASWKTAEKVGFERNREYAYYYLIYDLIDHLAELGWLSYKRGEYSKTAAYYEQVFSQRKENPDYYYHLAALAWAHLGNPDQALRYLQEAADRGWGHVEHTKEQEAFRGLLDTPQWAAILKCMEENSRKT